MIEEKRKGYTTKEVAERLGIDPSGLRHLYNRNKKDLEGDVSCEKISHEGKLREHLIWSDKAVKYAIKKLPRVAKEWKESIKDEFMEKGFIISRLPENGLISDDLLEQQMIQNLELFKRYRNLKEKQILQEREISTMYLELTDTRNTIIEHMQKEQENRPIEETTWKILRNYINQIHEETGIWLWKTINEEFGISSLKEGFKWRSIKQRTAENIRKWIEKNYDLQGLKNK